MSHEVVVASPNACNALFLDGNARPFVPFFPAFAGAASAFGGFVPIGDPVVPPSPARLTIIQPFTVGFTNPSNCRTVRAFGYCRGVCAGGFISNNDIAVAIDSGAALGAPPGVLGSPNGVARFRNLAIIAAPATYNIGNSGNTEFTVTLTIPPGQTGFWSATLYAFAIGGLFTPHASNFLEAACAWRIETLFE